MRPGLGRATGIRKTAFAVSGVAARLIGMLTIRSELIWSALIRRCKEVRYCLLTRERDIVFLFGAGASHGAGNILPESPPLGFQLYAELARVHPGSWGRLPAEIRRALQSNFEDGMQLIYDRMSLVIPELMRQMAVYFVQFRPASGRTLYCSLIDALTRYGLLDRVLFSTLNYDCVLELSMLGRGIRFNYFEAADSNPGVPVWKLHGSCNMFATGVEATPGVQYTAGATFEGGLRASLEVNEIMETCLVKTALAPAMALYMRGKPLNISPGVIRSLQARWKEAVSRSTAIFCVGVNPYPDDVHIWQPMAESAANLHFIGGKALFEAWLAQFRAGRGEFIDDRFASGFEILGRRLAEYAAQ